MGIVDGIQVLGLRSSQQMDIIREILAVDKALQAVGDQVFLEGDCTAEGCVDGQSLMSQTKAAVEDGGEGHTDLDVVVERECHGGEAATAGQTAEPLDTA